MCLLKTNKGFVVADTDITVFKKLIPSLHGKISSPFYNFKYEIGKIYKTYLVETKSLHTSCWEVTKGFHAYRRDGLRFIHFNKGEALFECIIPKGSKYAIGYDFEIVSNQIMIKGICDFSASPFLHDNIFINLKR